MRKPYASQIAGLALLYVLVFVGLIIIQFADRKNFSITAGGMTIRGHNSGEEKIDEARQTLFKIFEDSDAQAVSEGIRIYYGGLEFTLSEERGKGLTLYGNDEAFYVNPEYMILTGTVARFVLPGGTVLVFNSFSSPGGTELRINADFAEDISEVSFPITPRRSSLIRDSGQLGIMYSGIRYLFARPGNELENGRISLKRESSFLSYRSRGRQTVFNPADYITKKSGNYDDIVSAFRNSSFDNWNKNAAALQNEYDIIAYLSEALARGSFQAASAAIPRDFIGSTNQSFRSSPLVGGMSNAYSSITAYEKERLNLITRSTQENSLDFLKEEHVFDYLFTHNNIALTNAAIDTITSTKAESLFIDYCPGILEAITDLKYWRPSLDNPAGHLTDQVISIISDNLIRDTVEDHVFAMNYEGLNPDFSLRLGKALINWAEITENTEWEAIGKSLVISALEMGDAGRLYAGLKPANYNPRAAWLSDNGQWAWTVSPSVRAAAAANGDFTVTFNFPVNMTHYVILNGIKPFLRLQFYGTDWRTEAGFERSDSSGWVYYQQEQILVLKLRHRSVSENVRIIYSAPPPPPPAPPPPPPEPAVENTDNYYYGYY
ncbi:MAG: hypothetical protein FWC19_01880 [Treponema sp.]|nr:hypothetical protein [Treponema sp.]MCL2271541.1 hypothetical protein [Treponema sp.]